MQSFLLTERGSPEVFRGGKTADVLFLGQDPTIVSARHIPVVLDLANHKGRLYKYMFGTVCGGLNITKNRVLAWNLVNRYFTDKPRKLAARAEVASDLGRRFPQLDGRNGDWTTVRFLYYYFSEFGQQELEYIVSKYSPKALISLGEPVFRVLRHAYALPQGVTIPDNLVDFCCEHVFTIDIDDVRLVWLALPHQPTGDRSPHYKTLLAEKLPVIGPQLMAELTRDPTIS